MRKRLLHLPWRPTIRLYFIVMNIVVLCLLFPSVSYIFMRDETQFRDAQLADTIGRMRESLESRGAILARSMALNAEQAVAGYDFTFLNVMVQQIVDSDSEVLYCVIMDNERRAVVHSVPSRIGVVLSSDLAHQAANVLASDFPVDRPASSLETRAHFLTGTWGERGVPVVEALVPLYVGQKRWGGLRLGFSLEKLHDQIQRTEAKWASRMWQFQLYFLSLIGIFFTIGMLVAAFFTHYFLRTIDVLRDGVQRVGQGDLSHVISQQGLVCAEIVDFSDSFNVMTEKLRLSHQQLDEYSKGLEQKVEERTRALKEAQANLLRQAHQAGMAEMAVGILHNIGNAITPAKVGATLLLKQLDESPVRLHAGEALGQLATVVSGAVRDPAERERLLAIMQLLPAGIEDEYSSIVEELRQIRDKHEHIESIIKLQMRYARLLGASDEVDINRVAEDALRMLEDSLRKRVVRVEKNLTAVPAVRIEETQLLQVFINLIKNGFQAMDDTPVPGRRLVLTTGREDAAAGRVFFSVRDNGCGFSAEEEDKLFTFGYTSKQEGSGFGLHSCANYLIANGGSIVARSDGKGQGAEFTVWLPVRPTAAAAAADREKGEGAAAVPGEGES